MASTISSTISHKNINVTPDTYGFKTPKLKETSKRLPHENLEKKGFNTRDFSSLNKLGFPKPPQEPCNKPLKHHVAKQFNTINNDELQKHGDLKQLSVVRIRPKIDKLIRKPLLNHYIACKNKPNRRSQNAQNAHIIPYLLDIN